VVLKYFNTIALQNVGEVTTTVVEIRRSDMKLIVLADVIYILLSLILLAQRSTLFFCALIPFGVSMLASFFYALDDRERFEHNDILALASCLLGVLFIVGTIFVTTF